MNARTKILISIIPLLVISTIISIYFTVSTHIFQIKSITKNLKLIDINKDHNQALDTIEYAKENNIDIPSTIINFDTHSDVFLFQQIDKQKGAQISNWLNEFFAKYPNAKELYWVMPEEEAIYPNLQEMFKQKDPIEEIMLYGNSQKDSKDINPNVQQIPYVQYFLIDTNSGYTKEIANSSDTNKKLPLDPKFPKYKKIKITTCTISTLPNFKNQEVILSIDADYISNSGFDTQLFFTNNRDTASIKQETNKILTNLIKKEIKPSIISLTLSPIYVPDEDIDIIMKFYENFLKYSGKQDKLQIYSRQARSTQKKVGETQYYSF